MGIESVRLMPVARAHVDQVFDPIAEADDPIIGPQFKWM